MRGIRWLSLAVAAFGIAAGLRFLLERAETAALRSELEFLAQESRRASELRVEHARLLASKISDTELERLRSDRAALVRLRAEIDRLEQGAERKARLLETLKSVQRPAVVLNLEIRPDGGLWLDGNPMTGDGVRERFAQLAKGTERVDVRLRFDPGETPVAVIKERVESIARWQKEAELRMTLRFEKPDGGAAK